jgi:hypothetical protein
VLDKRQETEKFGEREIFSEQIEQVFGHTRLFFN